MGNPNCCFMIIAGTFFFQPITDGNCVLAILYLQHALAIHSTECILASFALLTRALSFDVVSKNMKCIFPFVASKLVRYQSFVLGCQVSK